MLYTIIRWIFPPITLDMYNQREQEDFMFWLYECEKEFLDN